MKTRKPRSTKLRLHRESLRILSLSGLAWVAGGETKGCGLPQHTDSCPTLCLTNCDSVCIC